MDIKYYVIIWIVCGIFNWGVTLGDFCGEYPDTPSRSNYGIAGFVAFT